MGKVERGEVGALPEDPAQEWRFSREGCMRHFVTNIACGKNEFVDTSALRYAEPVKLYLAALRNGHDAESVRTTLSASLRPALLSQKCRSAAKH